MMPAALASAHPLDASRPSQWAGLGRSLLAGAVLVWGMAASWPARAQMAAAVPAKASSAGTTIYLASTTSTEQSGLFRALLPRFKEETGIQVQVLALGTGQALDVARRGDADLVLVHDEQAELEFMRQGHGHTRQAVMYNDFILVGPPSDPAQVQGMTIAQALRRLHGSKNVFISRGDRSGTHAMELRLWAAAGLKPQDWKAPAYMACGCGMGPALNMAAATQGYVLTDRGTWLSHKQRASLALLVQEDPLLLNLYSVITLNPERFAHRQLAAAQKLAQWWVRSDTQAAIAAYKVEGQSLFFPVATPVKGKMPAS